MLILPVLVIGALAGAAPDAAAQGSLKSVFDAIVKPSAEAPVPQPPIEEQIAWARGEAKAAEALLGEASEKELSARIAAAGLPATRIEDFRTAAREVQRAATSAADLLVGIAALESEAATVPSVPVPSSEEEAATVRETLRRATLSEKSAAGEAELLGRMVTQFQTLSANADREIRQAQEEQAGAATDEAKARTALQLELAGWQKRAADANGFFARWRLYQQELIARKSQQVVDATAAALRSGGFDRQLNADRAAGQIKAVNAELPQVEKKLTAAKALRQQALDDRRGAPENAPAGRFAAMDALVEAAQGLVFSLEGSVSLLELERGHWQTVERLAQSQDDPEVRSAIAQANEAIRSLKDWRPLLDRRLSEAREALEGARKMAKETLDDAATRRLWERATEAAGQRVDALGAVIIKAEQILLMEKDFLEEMDAVLRQENLFQRAGRTWQQAGAVVAGIWSFELWHSGASRITVGKVVVALAGIVIALALAGLVARWGARTSRRSFSLGESQSLIVEKIVFFPAAALMVFTILNWLSIPLGAFTFLGGALAIGVGFGAQNLMNNFISGLILLTERQIKVGDIIEVGPSTGRITHLGTRCSRLRKFDGVEVLIPNSAFLEKEVTNWTLNDPLHRYDFTVGVAYGTPAERVIEILLKALVEQPEVMKDPEPGVFFENFGDSSLVFRLYYWLEVGGLTDARQVGSDIRRRIDRDFREAGIEMPFPQRDLHLRSPEVLQVRLEK
jgi:small-conductance mechanosensitive channel